VSVSARSVSPRERGVVLLLVLWVFMTLGVLALDFSSYMRDDAMATLNLADETKAYYLALAGMNRALYENARDRQNHPPGVAPTPVDPDDAGADTDGDGKPDVTIFQADGHWHEGTFGGGTFAVRLAGEDGKIPLNVEISEEDDSAYVELLRYVVTNVVRGGNQTTGVDKDTEQQISTIVDSILDWRDCDKEARLNGAEDDYYLGLARSHRAKNGFFDSPEELLQVRGVTPDIFYGQNGMPGLVDVFSPYPRGKELEINAGQVTAEVVRVLVSSVTTMAEAEDFLAQRETDPEAFRATLSNEIDSAVPGLGARVLFTEPEVVRVEARADVHQPRNQAAVAAILQLPGNDSELPIVYSWVDRAPLRGSGPTAPDTEKAPGAGPS
jgi:type II secretory pathway component PulK